jgi:hypothetical protein
VPGRELAIAGKAPVAPLKAVAVSRGRGRRQGPDRDYNQDRSGDENTVHESIPPLFSRPNAASVSGFFTVFDKTKRVVNLGLAQGVTPVLNLSGYRCTSYQSRSPRHRHLSDIVTNLRIQVGSGTNVDTAGSLSAATFPELSGSRARAIRV